MHILIICKNFPPIHCGVGDYTYNLAQEFAKNSQIKVSVITCGQIEKCVRLKNVEVHCIPENWNSKSVKTIVTKINEIKPTYILLQYVPYLYDPRGVPFYICKLLWLLRSKKVAIFFHEVAIEISKKPKVLIVSLLQRFIAYVLCYLSRYIIVSNECVEKFLKNKETKLIHIGSNIPQCTKSKSDLRKIHSNVVGKCDILFAMFGNIRYNYMLLPVLKQLHQQNISWKLILIGSYKNARAQHFYNEIYRLNLNDHIHTTGYVDVNDAAEYLAMSDIFLIWEPADKGIFLHSGALCAAFANSLVIVSSKGNLTDKILQHEQNAILLDNLDDQRLLKYIVKIHRDTEFRTHLQTNTQNLFAQYIAWDVVCKKHLELLKSENNLC
ncbi:glycosyltransferase family 4 protein [Candidatus Uabimicrobium sp. HlEnr_7]|uniref:glycosyltransferase family 4 protein n=1 Tax=Candidatus Uabimicrobium helgolandensis TaxID=3095367 RepID=UPI0035568E6F